MSNFFYTLYGLISPQTFNDHSSSNPILSTLIRILHKIIPNFLAQFPLWIALLFSIKKIKNPSQNPKLILLLLFLLFSFLAIFMGGLRLYNHYFIQYLPPLCLIAGYSLFQYLKNISPKKILFLNSLLFLFIAFNASWNYINAYLILYHPQKAWTNNRSLVNKPYANIVSWVKNYTQPSHQITVWGPHIPIYWFANRLPALPLLWSERYLFAFSITQKLYPQPIPSFNPQKLQKLLALPPNQKRSWKTPENILYSLISHIEKNKPSIIIDTMHYSSPHLQKPLMSLPVLSEYLKLHYTYLQSIDHAKIYLCQCDTLN